MEVTSERDRPAPLALIVDDEALLALEIEDLLLAEGFSTLVAHTEAEAKVLAVEHLAIAVVHLRLLGDFAGHRVIRFLRSYTPKLPVVVVTRHDERAPEAELRGLGWPTIRVHEPAHHEQLACAVWDAIDQASHAALPQEERQNQACSAA
jgi:DNA-binding response OmpR family regulator